MLHENYKKHSCTLSHICSCKRLACVLNIFYFFFILKSFFSCFFFFFFFSFLFKYILFHFALSYMYGYELEWMYVPLYSDPLFVSSFSTF